MANNTKVVTGMNTRLSYAHLFEPVSINGGAEKYSVSVLIPKDDKATIEKIEKAALDNGRTITAEAVYRLEKSFGEEPNIATIDKTFTFQEMKEILERIEQQTKKD